MAYTWGILVALLWVNSVLCKQCELNDSACLTEWANIIYPLIIKGGNNLGTSDPLHRDLIEADLPSLKYILRNAEFTGMKDCSVAKLELNKDNKKVEYHVQCPKVTVKADHEAKGDIAGFNVDIKGSCTITAEDYIYKISGNTESSIGADGKKYVQITDYEVNAKANGNLKLDFKNDYDGSSSDFNAVQKFLNENWKDMDDFLRKPAVQSFMKLFIDNVNAYLKVVPFEPFVPDN